LSQPDPFTVLDLAPRFDLDRDELESRYLALSRAGHPDHHADLDPAAMRELLARAAAVNDAYRLLRDPFERARALVDRLDAGAFEAQKQLDPAFLLEAMELAEEVAGADPGSRPALAARLRAMIDADLGAIGAALAAGDAARAAALLHQSKYHRKALADLQGAAPSPR
jgi:molecular chaperone HscB